MPDGAVVDLIRADAGPIFGQPQRRPAVLRGGKNQVAVPVVDDAGDRALVALEEDGAHRGLRGGGVGACWLVTAMGKQSTGERA